MYFDRSILPELKKWKNSLSRKPLILKGARQVGKTHLLKKFGKDNFLKTAYFNFEEQPELKQFFEKTKDVKRIIQNLSLLYGSPINPENTLIIFDEIQECNPALNSLKYFYENAPQYFIACAGSLLGISLGKGFSFPVGKVEFLNVYPLTFSEFLAVADPTLASYLQQIETLAPILDIFYNNLVEKFKLYFISGGMPEAVNSLLAENDLERCQKNLRDILNAYELDFSKHADIKDIPKINHVWKSMPAQLARENKKFLYQTVRSGARARGYEDAITWLINAGLIYKVSLCSKPNIPISAYDDLSAFKLYLLDVGVLRSLSFLDPVAIREGNRLFTEFKGALTENYILQSLIPQFDVTPRYWTSEGKAEVDFLIQFRNEIIPIEVKSNENIRSKSLTYYDQKYNPKLRIRYSLKNLLYEDNFLNIPLFLADQTKKYIEKLI